MKAIISGVLILTTALLTAAAPCAYALDEVSDPLEGINRATFWVNDQLDMALLEPAARGYDYVVPEVVQDGVTNFFDNLRFPIYLVSDLVQLKFTQAAEHTGRFVINTTVGIGGILDVAKHVGLERHREDFGIALAYHGVPPGPYLVLPILGPSNVRDTVGLVVDFFLDPLFWLGDVSNMSKKDEFWVEGGIATLKYLQLRADLIEAVEAGKESAIDYYLFTQGAYLQYREGLLYDGAVPEEDSELAITPEDPSVTPGD